MLSNPTNKIIPYLVPFKVIVCPHLSAMTNPTLNSIPDAGRNGTTVRARPIPDVTLLSRETRTRMPSIAMPRYSSRDQMFAMSDREVTRGIEPSDQSQQRADGDRRSHALMA